MDIFEYQANQAMADQRPLAERMRPRTLDAFVGQEQAVGPGTLIRHAAKTDQVFSMILWGPPGTGKTTLARIIARTTRSHFVHFSAVLSGVKDIRAVIEIAGEKRRLRRQRTILFVDEIHRFSKSQQDAFLPHVESGLLTLIGATTQNPSFELIAPLLSRCRVITLESLSHEALGSILDRALTDTEQGLGGLGLALNPEARAYLIDLCQGDARSALNSLEMAASLAAAANAGAIRRFDLEKALAGKLPQYDRWGEAHFNLISAFHKSLRGSDPDAALYWLARMLSAGEDPFYVARRMVRFASEDLGNADPSALGLALNAVEAFRFLGPPEGELALAQAALYLACAPKSNRCYEAYGAAQKEIKDSGALPVPLYLRNAPTPLMKGLGYGQGYQYAHDYSGGFTPQRHLPEAISRKTFYHPSERGYEKTIKTRLDQWRQLRAAPDSEGG